MVETDVVTPSAVYAVALDGLNNIQRAVKTASESWAATPTQNAVAATVPVQTAINQTVSAITESIAKLPKEESVANDMLTGLIGYLNTYKNELVRRPEALLNAADLTSTWKTTLRGILQRIIKVSPAVAGTPAYKPLEQAVAE